MKNINSNNKRILTARGWWHQKAVMWIPWLTKACLLQFSIDLWPSSNYVRLVIAQILRAPFRKFVYSYEGECQKKVHHCIKTQKLKIDHLKIWTTNLSPQHFLINCLLKNCMSLLLNNEFSLKHIIISAFYSQKKYIWLIRK